VRQDNPRALAESIEKLKQSGDLPGLMARLADKEGDVRSRAAVALSRAVPETKEDAALEPWIKPLTDATLEDTDGTVREYAGRALMDILRMTKDERALLAPVDTLIDALRGDAVALEQRRSPLTAPEQGEA